MRVPRRGAFTLVELLVAMALTLLLVYALAEFYSYVGDTVRDGRAIVEMGSDIRNAVRQLRDDLNSVTVHPKPPVEYGSGTGMLEIVEGIRSDIDVNGDQINDPTGLVGTMLGDMDDVLTMTIRSNGAPFTAQYKYFDPSLNPQFQARTVESHVAEVVWFTTFKNLNAATGDTNWDAGEPPGTDLDSDGRQGEQEEPRFLVRRVFLVAPNIEGWRDSNGVPHYGEIVDPSTAVPDNVFQHNDLSLSSPTFDQTLGRWIWKSNTLSTLTRRENRFVHLNLDYNNLGQNGLLAANNYRPNRVMIQVADSQSMQLYTLQNTPLGPDKTGEDLVLPNLLAFDVRVYDPTARMYGDDANANNALAAIQPGDPGYAIAYGFAPANPIGFGAYVDLFYNRPALGLPANLSYFSDQPSARSYPGVDALGNTIANYDTWTTFYERDTYDQDVDMVADEGTDGLDNPPSTNGVDDYGEFETSPPYLAPLRGIQVRIRMYEPGTRQTRQATVVADFVEE